MTDLILLACAIVLFGPGAARVIDGLLFPAAPDIVEGDEP